MSKATADWVRVNNRFYRRTQIYTSPFDDAFELEDYILVGAPYGGAIALYRDRDKIVEHRAGQPPKSSIDIFSCAGRPIRSIPYDRANIVSVGWSEDERLIVVAQDGTVRTYAELETDFDTFSLGHGAEEHGVRGCKFWKTGFVALLGDNSLVAVTSYDEPRPQLLASSPSGDVASWTVIAPEQTSSRSVEVLLAIDSTVFVVDAAECEDRGLQAGPFRHIGVSSDGRCIALYTDDGKMWVISSDFQNRIAEYETKIKTPPRELLWCGSNAVVLAWEDELHVVGDDGTAWRSGDGDYTSFVHLLPDVDGIRIINNDICEFLQRVPDVVEEIYRPGASSPAAILVDAVEQLDRKLPRADDNIQLIRSNLDQAVDDCVRAAGEVFGVDLQKQLLKAASFGKSILELYNSDDFVEMTETLRVLNAVRFYEIGLPLSYEQYTRLTPERLIQRLVNRREYLLALKVAEFLRLPVDRIYVHWARQKVRASTADDASTCAEIVHKLKGQRGISFEEVARAAFDEVRNGLATELLAYEARAGKQVPLLLKVGEESLALDKAIDSGDTDLVFFVLLSMKRNMQMSDFFRTISSRPTARAIVEASAIDQDQELLRDLYYQSDRRLDGANLLISEALAATGTNAATNKLTSAGKLLSDSKEYTLQTNAIREAQMLLRLQETLEKDLNERFVGLSIDATMGKLIAVGQGKRAQKVQSDFKVTAKTYSWVRLRALVGRRDWQELRDLAGGSKSAIGWEPYFNEIMGAGNPKLAALFVEKCTDLSWNERMEMWLKCGMPVRAAEEAAKAKDLNALEELRSKASAGDQLAIDRLIAQLRNRR